MVFPLCLIWQIPFTLARDITRDKVCQWLSKYPKSVWCINNDNKQNVKHQNTKQQNAKQPRCKTTNAKQQNTKQQMQNNKRKTTNAKQQRAPSAHKVPQVRKTVVCDNLHLLVFVVFGVFSCICVMAFLLYIYSLYATPFSLSPFIHMS